MITLQMRFGWYDGHWYGLFRIILNWISSTAYAVASKVGNRKPRLSLSPAGAPRNRDILSGPIFMPCGKYGNATEIGATVSAI